MDTGVPAKPVVCAVTTENGVVTKTAPYLWRLRGWTEQKFLEHGKERGWRIELLADMTSIEDDLYGNDRR